MRVYIYLWMYMKHNSSAGTRYRELTCTMILQTWLSMNLPNGHQ